MEIINGCRFKIREQDLQLETLENLRTLRTLAGDVASWNLLVETITAQALVNNHHNLGNPVERAIGKRKITCSRSEDMKHWDDVDAMDLELDVEEEVEEGDPKKRQRTEI